MCSFSVLLVGGCLEGCASNLLHSSFGDAYASTVQDGNRCGQTVLDGKARRVGGSSFGSGLPCDTCQARAVSWPAGWLISWVAQAEGVSGKDPLSLTLLRESDRARREAAERPGQPKRTTRGETPRRSSRARSPDTAGHWHMTEGEGDGGDRALHGGTSETLTDMRGAARRRLLSSVRRRCSPE